ncbi:uncharacterized protein LOC133182036 [Saccostrea echinata]|uniref:uncharacterized protein LOC133182036 n=1 Tax=Saccostrea echinata TaxID=191078 RepID=UPI002A806430|nr:uncharacterized protein LOC133182036 [Saccostrea echinata]
MADIMKPLSEPTNSVDTVTNVGDQVQSVDATEQRQVEFTGNDEDTKSNTEDVSNDGVEIDEPSESGKDETDGDAGVGKKDNEIDLNSENEESKNNEDDTSFEDKDKDSNVNESVNEKDSMVCEEVAGTETQTEEEEEEEGIEINENDIVKATDVFGKGKRQHVKKVDGEYTDNFETRDSTPQRQTNRKVSVMTEEQRELLLKPFKEGWRREVVFRSTYTPVTKHGAMKSVPADVYYHPPEGRKLRSMVDITKYLVMTNSDLTIDNFSFLRKPILEPPFEVVRSSGSVGRGGFGSPKTPRLNKESKPQVVIERDGEEKELSDGGQIRISQAGFIRRKRGRPPSGINKNLLPRTGIPRKRGRPPSSKTVEIIKLSSGDSEIPKVESTDSSSPSEPSPKRSKPTARKSTTQGVPKPFKPAKQIESAENLEELCNLNCPGRNLVPPSLQCLVCLCLFHPECVNTDPDTEDFVCLRCVTGSAAVKKPKPQTVKLFPIAMQNINGKPISANIPVIKSISATRLTPEIPVSSNSITTTSTVKVKQEPMDTEDYGQAKGKNAVSSTTMGTLKSVLDKRSIVVTTSPMPVLLNSFSGSQASLAFNGSSPQISVSSSNALVAPNPAAFTAIPNLPIFNPLNAPNLLNQLHVSPNVVNQPTAFTSAKVNYSLPSISPVTQPPPKLTAAPTPKSSPDNSGIEITQTSKNGQLLTLPSAVAKRLNLKQPLALKINNMQITVPPSCLLVTADGLKVFLPPKTFPVQLGETAKLCVTVTNDKSSSPNTKISVNIGSSTQKEKTDSPDSKKSRPQRQWRAGINPANCQIKKLYGGFDCMLCIFQYLNMHDLARVSLVCRTWRALAQSPMLWQEVKLRNVRVADWKKAVRFLLQRAAHSLNLRGLEHYESRNHTWHQFLSVLPQLTCIQNIHFGLVPGSVLQHVCEKMPHLEVFTAEWISDYDDEQKWDHVTKLNIGKFSSLPNLSELKLRGVVGLALPSFTLSGGLDDLSSLKQLRKLSLTTLTNVEESEFAFLEKMEQLECLELGDCPRWTSKTYSLFSNLKNLRILRLENGGNVESDEGLGEALSQIKSLERLELIMFVLPETVKGLDHIKTLVIWPNTQKTSPTPGKVNSNMLKMVSGLKHLEKLEWGIMNNSSTSIILDNETSNTEWIPFLPNTEETSPGGSSTAEYISVIQFTANLTKALPNTRIKVYNSSVIQQESEM